jgi:hypothetical protein
MTNTTINQWNSRSQPSQTFTLRSVSFMALPSAQMVQRSAAAEA